MHCSRCGIKSPKLPGRADQNMQAAQEILLQAKHPMETAMEILAAIIPAARAVKAKETKAKAAKDKETRARAGKEAARTVREPRVARDLKGIKAPAADKEIRAAAAKAIQGILASPAPA